MTPEKKLGLAIEAVRDQLYAVIRCHENEEHAGEMCPNERFNAVAYLAHCLGMNSSRDTVKELRRRLREYERDCQGREEESDDQYGGE